MKNENKIIKLLKKGNKIEVEKAFEFLYFKYVKLVFYISLQITKQKEASEEITNDVFLSFFNNISNLKADNFISIRAWLTKTSRNTSLNYINKNSVKKEVLNNEIINNVGTLDINNNVNYDDLFLDYKEYISKEEFDMLVDHAIAGLTFREIAEKNNKTTNAISSKYRRIILKLKEYYKEAK